MNGFMPIQPFLHELFRDDGDRGLVGKGNLIFDDDMGHGVDVWIWKIVALFFMIGLAEIQPASS